MIARERVDSEAARVSPAPVPGSAVLAERCLHGSAYGALKRVRCECREGVLLLSGRVPSYYLKQVAQSLVVALPGVGRIENHIQVDAVATPGEDGP